MELPRESSSGCHSVIEHDSRTPNTEAPSPEQVLRHPSSYAPGVSYNSTKDAPECLRRCSTFDQASHPRTPQPGSKLISNPLNPPSTASLRNAYRSAKSGNNLSYAVTSNLLSASPTPVNRPPLEVLSPRVRNPGQCRYPGNLVKRLHDAAEAAAAAENDSLRISEGKAGESGEGRDEGQEGKTDERKEALERSVGGYYENLRRLKCGEIAPSPVSYWSDDSSEMEEGEMGERETEESKMEELRTEDVKTNESERHPPQNESEQQQQQHDSSSPQSTHSNDSVNDESAISKPDLEHLKAEYPWLLALQHPRHPSTPAVP
ncbi:MAG: hypothetical protein M1835_000805 [Candelina submexicana]|nr:MAG: hypothetical protein M1835_000805 [Candelina submexicana]